MSDFELSNTACGNTHELKSQLLKLRQEKQMLVKALEDRDEALTNMFSFIQGFSSK